MSQRLEDDKIEVQHVEVPKNHDLVDPSLEKHLPGEDDAARILREAGPVEYDLDEDKRVLRKIDWRVCLPMVVIYTLCHLDKNSLSYGATFDLKTTANLVGSQYAWLGSVVYVVQLIVQPLSAFALVRFPIAKWVLFNVTCWGISVTCMAACKSFIPLLITRAMVGGFEATISPSFIAIVQLWWRRREQTYRNTVWLLSSSIAGIIGPIMTFGIGHVNTPAIHPYQGIFLFLGLVTLACVPPLLWWMPDDIVSAKFLDAREKAIAVERLRDNNTGTRSSHWKREQVKEAFCDPKTWMWSLMLMLLAIPSSGIGTFSGLVTKGFGFDSFQAILFQIPASVCVAFVLIGSTFTINKIQLRFPIIAAVCFLPIAGAITLLVIPRDNPHALLGAYWIVMQYSALQPLLYSWANSNAAGTTKQRTVGAIMFVFQCAGNIAGPQVYLSDEAPIYKTGLYTDLGCWSAAFILIILMGFYLKYLNRKQEKRREALGRVGRLQDASIMTTKAAEAYKRDLAQQTDISDVNQHAFEDRTDFENPDFMYIL